MIIELKEIAIARVIDLLAARRRLREAEGLVDALFGGGDAGANAPTPAAESNKESRS